METIPLTPVFQNRRFEDFTPTLRYAVLNAVYTLANEKRLHKLPIRLQPYFGICNATYWRNKTVLHEVLNEILPEILRIKNVKLKQTVAATRKNSELAIKRKLQRDRKEVFFDEKATHDKITLVPPHLENRRHNQGRSDHVSTANAKTSNDQVQEKTFVDD